MSKIEKIIIKILRASSDNNFDFNEICSLLKYLDFQERIRGSHYIYTNKDIEEILNIQSKNGKAKAYQIKQIREIIIKYKLGD